MSDVTQILDAIQKGDPRQRRSCSRWSMTNCAGWRAPGWPSSRPDKPFKARPWSTKRGCAYPVPATSTGEGRAHFFAAAAEAMRHILVDRARRKRRAKHSGGQSPADADELEIAASADDDKVLMVHEPWKNSCWKTRSGPKW